MTRDEYTAALLDIARDTQAALKRARNAWERAGIYSESSRLRSSLAFRYARSQNAD